MPDLDLYKKELREVENREDQRVILIDIDEVPKGFFWLKVREANETGTNELHLSEIYLEKEARGLGVGKDVVGRLPSFFPALDMKELSLNVFDANIKAVKFYKDFGFERVSALYVKDISGPSSCGHDLKVQLANVSDLLNINLGDNNERFFPNRVMPGVFNARNLHEIASDSNKDLYTFHNEGRIVGLLCVEYIENPYNQKLAALVNWIYHNDGDNAIILSLIEFMEGFFVSRGCGQLAFKVKCSQKDEIAILAGLNFSSVRSEFRKKLGSS